MGHIKSSLIGGNKLNLFHSFAKKFNKISFDEVYNNKLSVMDMTAFTLCQENKLPIIIFDINKSGNLLKLAKGDIIGTKVHI